MSALGATGVVIWGSYKSTDKAPLCHELRNYTSTLFGPYIQIVTVDLQMCSEQECSSHGRCIVRFKDIPYHEIIHGPELELEDPKLQEAADAWKKFFMEEVPKALQAYGKPRELELNGRHSNGRETGDETHTPGFGCQCYAGWTGETCNTPAKM